MTFDELVEFIEHRMRMSHIYQPLLIRTLVDGGGSATLRQLALSFLAEDESQIRYYEDRIKTMPLKVLTRHGVVERSGDLVSLVTPKLSLEQRARLRELCERKLQTFVQERGLGLWDYRLGETEPVPDSLRFQVLKAAEGRCALCGISSRERPLDVDHIIPRARGGANDLWNLQALCTKCNRSKRDQDQTDFRELPLAADPACPFCTDVADRIVAENGTMFAIADRYPVTPGHLLIIPRRHTPDFFSLSEQERQHANELLRVLQKRTRAEDASVVGFNVGANCGEAAGQTVMHAHIHLIPRRAGDTPVAK